MNVIYILYKKIKKFCTKLLIDYSYIRMHGQPIKIRNILFLGTTFVMIEIRALGGEKICYTPLLNAVCTTIV